jgi:hypothetical protein
MSRRLRILAVPALALLAPSVLAEAPRYRNFELAIYCPARDVRQMADGDWLARNFDMLSKQLKVGKVYLETHRSMQVVDRDTVLKAKQFFESRGVRTAGGITTVLDEGREFKTFCYTNPEHRRHLEQVVRFTASLFDELILDDFFFTTCKCERCIQAKGQRSWSEFRLALMKEAAQNVIVGPAKQVNPKIKVVIKYPNWYEHFPYAGFNLEAEPRIFDGIYTGNETRDPVSTAQHLQEYQSYSIQRYFENVKPGGNGGGWVDPYARGTLDRYAEQLVLTLLGKARELTLFCFSSLLDPIRQPDGALLPASRVAGVAADTLERADAILSQLGKPVGVASYKPYHSSGEDFLHSYLGMIGIPIELGPQLDETSGMTLLDESARFDPAIVARIQKQLVAGRNVVITSGLLAALQGKGIEQIVDLEVSDRKVATRRFSDFRNVFLAAKEILLPQLRYATNDSWEELTALDGANGYPLLHHADYANGRLYVLTVPDNFSDLYALPEPALDRIRRVVGKGLPVRLQGPSRVALFAYDNDSFVVHSFLEHHATVDVVLGGEGAQLEELTGAGPAGRWQPTSVTRDGETVFTLDLEPHTYRAFRRQAVAGVGGAPVAGAATPGAVPAAAAPADRAAAFAVNKRLGRGVNIIGYDPLWQDRSKARFRDEHFRRIKEAGFTSVRIVLQPFRLMDSEHKLPVRWFQTLDWAVQGALANGLAAIVDMHEFGPMAEDPIGRKEMLLGFWRQVAPHLKDAPDSVVFELLNEPFGKLTPELWNDFLKEALAIVRASNPKRVVVIGPGLWNGIGALDKLALPEDDPNLIVTVHYYEPMPFTHQGAPWSREHKDLKGVPWLGTDAERQKIEADFGKAQAWALAHGRPILLGEFGAYEKGDMESRARYTAHVARTAERLGWSWAYWQFDSDFIVYDIDRDRWVEPIRRALLP